MTKVPKPKRRSYSIEGRLTNQDLVKKVILETGLSKKDVEAVMFSFLAAVQEASVEGFIVELKGFGMFRTEMYKRRYYDINKRLIDDTTVTIKPRVTFTPSKAFAELVRRDHKSSAVETIG